MTLYAILTDPRTEALAALAMLSFGFMILVEVLERRVEEVPREELINRRATEVTDNRERDPRKNPIAGDILSKPRSHSGYREREVDEVDGGLVTYVGPDVCSPTTTLSAWRKWALGATVVRKRENRTK